MSGGKKSGRRRRAPAAGRPAERVALRQMRALAHPLRMKLLGLFAERPRTTKQAALVLGEPPTKLYHHVAALERAGIVRLRETRPNRGTVEKYFELAARRVEGSPSALRSPADRSAAGALVFDQARDELIRAIAARPPRSRTEMLAVRGVMHLSAAHRRELARELMRLMNRAVARARARRKTSEQRGEREHRPANRTRARRYSLTVALVPLDGEDER